MFRPASPHQVECNERDRPTVTVLRIERPFRFQLVDDFVPEESEKEQCDYEIFRRLRLLAAKDQEREAGNEGCQNNYFDVTRRLQCTEQFVASAAAPRFFRSEPAPEKSSAS